MQPPDIEIIAADTKAQIKAFLDLPYRLHANLPHWVAPLRMERAVQIDPKKNPGAAQLDMQHFLARSGGEYIGRITAVKNNGHLAHYNDRQGHFGHFDVIDDEALALPTARALLEAAQDWLRRLGLIKIVGPVNLSTNEDIGVLVEGFDTPPMLMMPHGHARTPKIFEALGFRKEIDVQAYVTSPDKIRPRPRILRKMIQIAKADPRISFRRMNKKDFRGDVSIAMQIFNDAWADNWGFVPFSAEQIGHLASELKPLIDSDLFWIAEYDGEPAAFAIILPNLNEAIDGLNGRLLPFGWAKLLYRLKIKGVKTARLPLMGLRRSFHNTKTGLALSAAVCDYSFNGAFSKGIEQIEMSWILESNKSMVGIIKVAEGSLYKTYRIYGKSL